MSEQRMRLRPPRPERQIRLSKPRPIEGETDVLTLKATVWPTSHEGGHPYTWVPVHRRAWLIPQVYASGSTTPARDNPLSSRWRYTMPPNGDHRLTARLTPA